MEKTMRKTLRGVNGKICFYVKPVLARILEGWLAHFMAQLSREAAATDDDKKELQAMKDALVFVGRISGITSESADAEVGRVHTEATSLLKFVDPGIPSHP